ncbi:calcium-dependent phosphotriesterase [Lipomyces oligophaga]|uniref:calcium-dependent phosphotriesterase n=1 Tax=Lipomyces oligophaga TaxID=45792 RepID=UPI0034CF7636
MNTPIVEFDQLKAATDIEYARFFKRLPSPTFIVYDAEFRTVLGSNPSITKVESRPKDQFAHEAGVYIKRTNKVYFTANFQTSNPVECYAVDCKSHKVEVVKYNKVVQANGACNYKDNILYCSQGDFNTESALVEVDPISEVSKVLIDNFRGRSFNSINDVVIHYETGDIWFTDPTYGYEQGFRPHPTLPSQVYRFTPSTGEVSCVADGFLQCNGLCFSPDHSKMYITDTAAYQAYSGPGDGHQVSVNFRNPATIYEYDVVDSGKKIIGRRTFAYSDNGVPDGIKCDVKGNVYSGCGDGIHVWNKDGSLIGKIHLGHLAANFCFVPGGMWIMAEHTLYLVEMFSPGALVAIEC